jgi:transposase
VGAAAETSLALADRSRVILACAEGGTISCVAAELGVSRDMVSKWRARFLEKRLAGLTDEPRPGRPRLISDEQVEQVINATLEQAPAGGDTHWSTRSMARSQGMSQSAVSRIWRAFGLKPHIVETWKLSTDPQFIDKVRDVVGLCMSPPENTLVLCVDEKSRIQALDRTAPCLPMLPANPARMTHDYVRNGTTTPVRRLRPGQRISDRPALPAPPPPGVPAVPEADRRRGAEGPGAAPGAGQLRHPQDSRDPPVAAEAPWVPPALHPGQLQLDEPRRALVRRAHQPETAPLSAPQRHRARNWHPQVDQRAEQEPQAVRLDQDRR